MEKLSMFFQQIGFKDDFLKTILDCFYPKSYEKGDLFLQEGKTNNYLGYIEKGVFQYYFNKEGDEITSYVAGENTFMASLASFIYQIPSAENIRAITEAKIWQISHKDLKSLIDQSEAFKLFYIGILENQIVCIDKSRLDFIMLTAEKRYEKMLAESPYILQQIPLQYLASILGVTPRHLSRIRRNITPIHF